MPIDPRIPLMGRPAQVPSPTEVFSQIAQLQAMRQQAEERAEVSAEKRAARERQKQIEQAMTGAITVDPATGEPTVDFAKLAPHLPAPVLFEVKKVVDEGKKLGVELRTANLTYEEKQQAYRGAVAKGVAAGGYDKTLFDVGIVSARKAGALSQNEADALLALTDPADIKRAVDSAIAQAGGKAEDGGFTLSEGQVRYGPGGSVIATGPAKAPPETAFTLAPGAVRFDASGQQVAAVPAAPSSTAGFTLSPGATRYDAAGNVVASRPPAPGGGSGGRGVTSGDAGKIAAFDSSRDDLAALSTAITQAGATGTGAAIAAGLPKWVTDLTGWGTDAKKKQALIDRVKQVIGKTLEEGVLRKEDEIKYEKILPTIGDAPDLVKSKLQGLDAAVAARRQTHLDALADAGYDVSRFQARPTRAAIGATSHKVGDIVTVKGQKVRVTKLLPNGKYEGVAVP